MNKKLKSLIALFLVSIIVFSSCSYENGVEIFSKTIETVEKTVASVLGLDENFVSEKLKVSASSENSAELPKSFLTMCGKMIPKEKLYGYSKLNDNQKELYRRISSATIKLSLAVDILDLSLTSEEISKTFYAFLNDSPEIFYLSDKYSVLSWFKDTPSVLMLYYMDGETIDEYDDSYSSLKTEANRKAISKKAAELSEKTMEIISPLNLKAEKEKVRFVHDRIATDTFYDKEYADKIEDMGKEGNQSTSYGCIVEKKAVCSGITEGASLLLSLLGVENTVCYGKSEEIYHEWNIVKIKDNYYHLDITWDISLERDNKNWVGYEYYLLNDIRIATSRTVISEENPDENFVSLPKPDCTDDSLYIFDDITSRNKNAVSVATAMKKAVENNIKYVVIFSGTENPDKVANYVYNSSAKAVASGFCGKKVSFGERYYVIDNKRVYQSMIY